MLSKNAKIFLSIMIVLFLGYMVIDFNMNKDKGLKVAFDPQEYSFETSTAVGIGLSGNAEGAEGIIYTSNYGYFLSIDEDGNVLREGYSIKVSPDRVIYWVPEKIGVGDTVKNAVVVTAVRGLSDTMGSVSISVTQNEDFTYIANVVEVVK